MDYNKILDDNRNIYENLSRNINEYINNRQVMINRLNLAIERANEEIENLPLDTPSRNDIIEAYKNRIKEAEKNIETIINPSSEERSRIIDELTSRNKRIEQEKRNIDQIITTLKEKQLDLNYNISKWHMSRKMLNREYYDLVNENEKIRGTISNLESIKAQYDKLKDNLKEYENNVFKSHYDNINDILNKRNENPEIDDEEPEVGDDEPEIGDEKPEIGDEEPEIGDEEPEIGDDEPEVGDDEPEVGDDEPEIGDEEPEIPTNNNYLAKLSEYNKILEIYNEDLETLYEMQKKYENDEIEYSSYLEFANYMVERYRFIIKKYNELKESFENDITRVSTTDLEKELEELNKELNEMWHTNVQIANGEIEDNRYNELLKRINEIKAELELRRKNPIRTATNEELIAMRNDLFRKISEQQNPDEYHHRAHKENGMEGYEEDEIDRGLKQIREELESRNQKLPEKPNQPMMILENKKIIVDDGTTKKEQKTTLYKILDKIHGHREYSVTAKESKRYRASQIKVYNKLPKNNRGNAYKVASIGRKILNVLLVPSKFIWKSINKLLVTDELEDKMENIRENINNLTEEEIQILLEEYGPTVVSDIGIAPAVNDMINAKVHSYLMAKVNKMNERIAELLIEINTLKNLIDNIETKLANETLTEKERTDLISSREKAYARCANDIKETIELKKEGNLLLNGSTSLHGFSEGIRAGMSKMNRTGGRFAKDYESDAELLNQLALADDNIISNDPHEVVKGFFENEKIYKENTKEKRSIRNLFSKVSVGKLNYNPFIRNADYANDPFVSDIMTSIMLISTIASISSTIAQNAKIAAQNKEIMQQNKDINSYNSQIDGYNSLRDNTIAGQSKLDKAIETETATRNHYTQEIYERTDLDGNGWDTNSSSYITSDAMHHNITAQSTIDANKRFAAIDSDLNSGIITAEQATQLRLDVLNDTYSLSHQAIKSAEPVLKHYASTHGHDYTAIINGINANLNNPTALVESLQQYVDLITEASNLAPLTNISQINTILSQQSIVPGLLGLASTTILINENNKKETQRANTSEWDEKGKFTSLLEKILNGEKLEVEEIQYLEQYNNDNNERKL